MGIAQKHWYRFGFLKSDEWKDFRLVVLVHYGERCFACKSEPESLDIHHLWYPSRTLRVWDARPLCRKCHDDVHKVTSPKEYKDIEDALAAFYQFLEERLEIPESLKARVMEKEEWARERRERNIANMERQKAKGKKRREEIEASPEIVDERHRKDIRRLHEFLDDFRNGRLVDCPRDNNLKKWLEENSKNHRFVELLKEETGIEVSNGLTQVTESV